MRIVKQSADYCFQSPAAIWASSVLSIHGNVQQGDDEGMPIFFESPKIFVSALTVMLLPSLFQSLGRIGVRQ